MSTLHSRMPVILEVADWPAWPAMDGILRIWPADKKVGNVRNDGPDLLEQHVPPEPADDLVDPPGPNRARPRDSNPQRQVRSLLLNPVAKNAHCKKTYRPVIAVIGNRTPDLPIRPVRLTA